MGAQAAAKRWLGSVLAWKRRSRSSRKAVRLSSHDRMPAACSCESPGGVGVSGQRRGLRHGDQGLAAVAHEPRDGALVDRGFPSTPHTGQHAAPHDCASSFTAAAICGSSAGSVHDNTRTGSVAVSSRHRSSRRIED